MAKLSAETVRNRDFVDSIRELMGYAPLYATDVTLSHRAKWIARYGRGWNYVNIGGVQTPTGIGNGP